MSGSSLLPDVDITRIDKKLDTISFLSSPLALSKCDPHSESLLESNSLVDAVCEFMISLKSMERGITGNRCRHDTSRDMFGQGRVRKE